MKQDKMKQHAMIRKVALFFAVISLALGSSVMHAQQNMAALKPPAGAHVAIFEFADLECPMCARENPTLKDAAAKYHVPWLRHDFPLPQHNWSFQAAVNARWFDEQPKHLGNEYRDAVFANQINIETKDDLRQFTEKFAQQHGVALPFVIDPQNKLSDAVKADGALGTRMGVHQTPTVWVVTDRTNGAAPYTEVTDFSKLYTTLDEAVERTGHKKG
jgi:protein-disulfide isomerase